VRGRDRSTRSRLVAGLGLALAIAGCAADPVPPPPMLPDLRVVPPPPSVPREHARYAGRWTGKWEGQLDHILVVEIEVESGDSTEVVAVSSWGVALGFGVGEPGWARVRGRIQNGSLRLDLPRVQAMAVYVLRTDGALDGEYWRGPVLGSRVRMTRGIGERPGGP
jgi:hypothetical protein